MHWRKEGWITRCCPESVNMFLYLYSCGTSSLKSQLSFLFLGIDVNKFQTVNYTPWLGGAKFYPTLSDWGAFENIPTGTFCVSLFASMSLAISERESITSFHAPLSFALTPFSLRSFLKGSKILCTVDVVYLLWTFMLYEYISFSAYFHGNSRVRLDGYRSTVLRYAWAFLPFILLPHRI